MSGDKTEFASASSQKLVHELPDCYVCVRIEPFSAKARILPYTLKRPSTSFHEITILKHYNFKFTKIFDQDSSQTEVFDNSVRDRVVDFINGKNSLIFAYGSPYTGMTMCGTIRNPGIIPRSIELLFSSVRCSSEPWCKINKHYELALLNEQERAKEVEFKNKVLNSFKSRVDVKSLLTNRSSNGSESNDQGNSADTCRSCVWIAACSVLDKTHYDEMDVGSAPMKVSYRKNGLPFAEKLKYVHISTPMEAYQLLFGITSLRRLSDVRDERRLCFQVALLKYQKENPADTVSVRVLTFVSVTNDKPVERDGEPDWPFLELQLEHISYSKTTTTYIANVDMDIRYLKSSIITLKAATGTL